ncbi:MAG: hypothetical protein E6Q68_03285 [Polynucleobacter sp.]|nr:MAG: hypothetical protein E6Q68_03285 [Polynucleobacter sp.]
MSNESKITPPIRTKVKLTKIDDPVLKELTATIIGPDKRQPNPSGKVFVVFDGMPDEQYILNPDEYEVVAPPPKINTIFAPITEPWISIEVCPCRMVTIDEIELCEEDICEFYGVYIKTLEDGFSISMADFTDKAMAENLKLLIESSVKFCRNRDLEYVPAPYCPPPAIPIKIDPTTNDINKAIYEEFLKGWDAAPWTEGMILRQVPFKDFIKFMRPNGTMHLLLPMKSYRTLLLAAKELVDENKIPDHAAENINDFRHSIEGLFNKNGTPLFWKYDFKTT